jgi:large subunit ribosomal protein L35
MPKMKSHRGAAKRFRTTRTGKIMRRRAYRNHLLDKKDARRKRRLGRPNELSEHDRRRIGRLLAR